MSVERQEQIVKACEIEYDFRFKELQKAKHAFETAEADLRSARAVLKIAVAAAAIVTPQGE